MTERAAEYGRHRVFILPGNDRSHIWNCKDQRQGRKDRGGAADPDSHPHRLWNLAARIWGFLGNIAASFKAVVEKHPRQ
ncbi:hypothetical protein D3C73_669570 [compost metagenome]